MLHAHNSLLLIVDMQAKLLPAINKTDDLQTRVNNLAKAANLIGVPVWATEHWPEKIGSTYPAVADKINNIYSKTHFNACQEPDFIKQLPVKRTNILLAGTESHICVLQTGLGLMQAGFKPILLKDCIGSRKDSDYQAACDRWAGYGLESVSSEMAIYEWLETPSHPAFKEILSLIK